MAHTASVPDRYRNFRRGDRVVSLGGAVAGAALPGLTVRNAADPPLVAVCLVCIGLMVGVATAVWATRSRSRIGSDGVKLDRTLTRIHTVVRDFSDMVMVVDAAGIVRYSNPAATRILGYGFSELAGTAISSMALPADLASMTTVVAGLRASRDLAPEFELRLRHKDGSWRHLEASAAGLSVLRRRRGVIVTLRDVTDRKRVEQRLAHQALHDPVTGLANRALFMDRLEQALVTARPAGQTITVLFLDLDRFKAINDTLGHAVGDHLLIAVAQRLAHHIPVDGLFARFGGDEVAVLLGNNTDSQTAAATALRLVDALRRPLHLAGHEVVVTASVGVASSGAGAIRASDLLRDADVALYRAKHGGGGMYVVFDSQTDSLSAERLDLEADLRRAVDRREFELYYQPDVDLRRGRIAGAEALIRWRHPLRGLRSPSEFIPLAEENGLIFPIGQWVLQAACTQARRWQDALPPRTPFVMSLNLSARQFEQTGLPQSVADALRGEGLEPSRLKLEITESVLMRDTDATLRTLCSLRDLGVQLAIDDFGTGYSSFGYLRRFPVNTVKIDQSFVRELGRDAGATAIVEAISRIAHALEMDVTAEGIESQLQLDSAQAARCDRGQGYFFSEPLPAPAATEILLEGGACWIPAPSVGVEPRQLLPTG